MSTNYIDQITDTAGTTHDISEGDSTRIFRATCPTAAGTAAKVATLQTSDRNFSLATGVRVAVTFTYGNSAATPTLNVNSTGAKTIAVATSATAKTTGNGTTYNTWGPYETVLFTYDGTYWVNKGSSLSIYNAYALANSKSSFSGSYNDLTDKPTIPTLPSNIVNTITTTAGTHTVITSKTGDVSFNVPTKTSHLTNDSGFITSDSDTKNTAGSTDTSSKIYLIGATSQAENPQTYSHDTAYVGTNGHLYSASKEVLVGGSNASSSVTITPSTTSVYSMSSAGSVTAGTAPSLSMTMDSTDTKKLNITFNAGTTPSTVTLPGRTQVSNLWNGYTAATAAAQVFTGQTS